MSSYRVAPVFLIRAPGVPFDVIERLATQNSSALAREILVQRQALEQARAQAEALLGSRESGVSAEVSRASRAVLRNAAVARNAEVMLPDQVVRFSEVATEISAAEAKLEETLRKESDLARAALRQASIAVLPGYLLFGAGEFRERLIELEESSNSVGPSESRNARVRERDRHLHLYLQRVCAKNDTFGEFGPSAWGTIERTANPFSFAPRPGIAERETFLERWTAHNFAAALNLDVDARQEFIPRINPNGRLEGEKFLLGNSGAAVALTKQMQEVLAQCDGKKRAHELTGPTGFLEQLAADGVILWEAEVPAMEPHAFSVLVSDIEAWRDGPARTRWLERAQKIAVLPKNFATASEATSRAAIMAEARRLLTELGIPQKRGQRFLFSAANPIAEECSRDCGFRMSEAMTDELAHDAQPWFDLWRDTYAFVAGRVARGLRVLWQSAPLQNGAIPLPAFLQHCASNQMPLTGHGMVALAHVAFQEVKAAFRNMMAERCAAECELTAEDCGFVGRNFSYEKFDEYTYPSADLQLSAASFAAAGRGDYQWVVSELHPPVALLHHALYWSCPDKPALSRALASTVFDRPGVHYGFFAADFTAHTTVRQMDALPELMTFAAPQRSNPRWRTLPPAEVDVFVDQETGDVAMRRRGSHEYLGSFARSWVIPLGFHPFSFGTASHTPRLRCGKVIVQRRAWTVRFDELQFGNFTGVSPALVLAVEQLRTEKGWPRYIYMRPTEQALRRSGAEGRDKDTKPVFVDLESYLSLEIFYRWLKKAGELEVTEMLPDPDHLCWQEADGRRTFELRTLIVPRT